MPSMIGEHIGRYHILEEIGAGGMGIVYRALDTRLNRMVAIKFLAPQLNADAESRARFAHEAMATSALDHPNICTIFEIDETTDGRIYIVMAYYEGETVEGALRRGPLSMEDAIAVVAQASDGLARAHRSGIVHRDIKPSNVFVTKEGWVKILDFGIAKMAGATTLTRTGSSPGTPGFMSPEQFEGKPVDHRADIWALGTLLHAALTGSAPFHGNLHALFHAVMNREPEPFPPTMARGSDLQRIRDRCMRKRAEDRYDDAATLALELRAIASTGDATRGPTEFDRRVEGSRSRQLLIAGMLTILTIIGGWVAWPSLRSRVLGSAGLLRVAVLPPRVQSEDSTEVAWASAASQAALMSGLANLRGVSGVDPVELGSDTKNVVDAVRITAADEAMTVSLAPMGREWNVTLRRLDGAGGNIKWSESFAVPREDPLVLDAAIRTHLPRGFPRHRRVPNSFEIDRDSFDEYIKLLRTSLGGDLGGVPRDQLIPRLELLARSKPHFTDVQLLLGHESLKEYVVTRRQELLQTAFAAGKRARDGAPLDARPLSLLADCALRARDSTQANRWIAELRKLEPGEADVLILEGKLAEQRGDSHGAHQLTLEAFRHRGSRANLRLLADQEVRLGLVTEARAHLRELIERSPAEPWPRSKLANVELSYGRPEAADSLYSDLIRESPRMPYLTNRGLARMLMGRYVQATEDFRAALEIAPAAWSILLNLADCELLQGRQSEARDHYRQVVDRLSPLDSTAGWQEHLARAQALAHMKNRTGALTAAQNGLRIAPENPEALYQAALVYALIGDPTSAVDHGRRAIAKGFESRWFGLPWFDEVRPRIEPVKKPMTSATVRGQ